MHSSPPEGPILPYPLRRFPPCRATATVSPRHIPLDREKVRPIASAVRDLAFAPRKSYPWTVNFGGGTGANASNSPVRFDYLSLTDHANGGVRRKIHSLQELSDYLVSNRSLLDSLEQAQLNRFLLNNVHSSEDLQNLNETERHQVP